MTNNFKKYQTTRRINICTDLSWLHGEDYGHSIGHQCYTTELYDTSISILHQLKLMPDAVEVKEFRDKDCIELIYYLTFCDHLHIRMQPDLYSYYTLKKNVLCRSTKMLSPQDRCLTWPIIKQISDGINNLTKDLLNKRIKEHDYKRQSK